MARPVYNEVTPSAAFPGSFQKDLDNVFQSPKSVQNRETLKDWLKFAE